VAITTEPVDLLEFAGENGLSVHQLSWNRNPENRGIHFGTMRNTNDQWSGAMKFDGGVRVGGSDKPETWPATKEDR